MTLLTGQEYVSPQRGMPVETMDDSQRVETISGETVQFYYNNAGTLTADAGQAAGTIVVGSLAQKVILNALGTRPATHKDTSLSFTSTAATTLVGLPSTYDSWDALSAADRLTKAAATLTTQGDYFVDWMQGEIYINKASTQTSLAATTYKVPVRGGSASFTLGAIDLTKVGGTAVTLGQKAATASIPVVLDSTTINKVQGGVAAGATDSGNPVKVGGKYNSTLPTLTNGQRGDLQVDDRSITLVTLARDIAGEDLSNGVLGVAQKLTASATYAYSIDLSAALESSSIIKASQGSLYRMFGRIDKTAPSADYWLHVVDSATVPADGAVTRLFSRKYVHVTGTDTFLDLDLGTGCINGVNGLVAYLSSTEFTKTIVAGSYLSLECLYK